MECRGEAKKSELIFTIKKRHQKFALWFKIHNLFVHFIKVGCQNADTRIYTTWNTGHKDSLNINKSND